ncbi:MAG: hypothetical protein ACYDCQ_00535 [Dehalococcoidia bacterium]
MLARGRLATAQSLTGDYICSWMRLPWNVPWFLPNRIPLPSVVTVAQVPDQLSPSAARLNCPANVAGLV